MLTYVISRLAQALAVMLVMSLAVFAGVYAVGNPLHILIPPDATQADAARLAASLGLDQPLWRQYLAFLTAALHGNLGTSFAFNVPAIRLILERLPATLELALSASVLALALGIPLGLWAGYRPTSLAGRLVSGASMLAFSLPTFFVGLLLVTGFSVYAGWLPAGGRGSTRDLLGVPVSFLSLDGLRHLVLPAANLALVKLALITRLTRAGTRDALTHDYVRFARSKGLSERRVLGVHVLKNILIPITTVAGLEFGSLIAFAVVTESIFAWPGVGKLLIDSINTLDRPVIVAYLCVTVLVFVIVNLLVDLAYALLDPRARAGGMA